MVTYILGSLLYRLELDLYAHRSLWEIDFGQVLTDIFVRHLLTFVPWAVGTSILFTLVGHLFYRQMIYRQTAQALADRDSMTLLYNHRYFTEHLASEIQRVKRGLYAAVSVLMLDIDDFKAYNDRYGHLAGDEVLKALAAAIVGTARVTDVVARYGGEEISVIAVGADKEQGIALAERIRQTVKLNCSLSVSVGISSYPGDGKTVNDLIQAADTALYRAKRAGKDRVVTTQPLIA